MKYSEVVKYFREASVSNKILRHRFTPDRKTFRSMSIDEIINDQTTNLKEISLVLEEVDKRGRDLLSDNKRKLINIAFLVIMPAGQNDFEKQQDAYDKTEEVTEQILAKICNDAKKAKLSRRHQWRIQGFDPNSVRHQRAYNLFDGWFGWRTSLTIDQGYANNLVLDENDWLHDTKFEI